MEENLKSRKLHNAGRMSEERYEEIRKFASRIESSYRNLIFSSLISDPSSSDRKIGVIFVVDDFNNMIVNPELAKVQLDISEAAYTSALPLECDFMLASAIWQGFKAKDEKILSILRDSLVVGDRGFILPLQELLVSGKVRPSKEGVKVYFLKSESSLKAADEHVRRAIVDLYWAVLDSAHAAVMVAGISPPSPGVLAETVKREFVARNLVHARCADIIDRIYSVARKIMHKEVFAISGKEFDAYLRDADFFIKEMDDFVREHGG